MTLAPLGRRVLAGLIDGAALALLSVLAFLVPMRLLGERLTLKQDELVVTFQSRFGKAEWLQPYTEPTLIELARQGVARVDVMCPGFTSDCLETLEEIDQEARDAFLEAGGKEFHYIPCLNDSHPWIAAMADIAIRHLQGWPTRAADPALLDAEQRRALFAPRGPARGGEPSGSGPGCCRESTDARRPRAATPRRR